MGLRDGEEHDRDDARADGIDMVGEAERPDGVGQIDPLHGLMNPGEGTSTPASDTDAPVPPG